MKNVTPFIRIVGRDAVTRDSVCQHHDVVAFGIQRQRDRCRASSRYGISTDDPNKWRYYLDSVEVHLPPFWEQYINDENTVELIYTDSLPLVISLNGH
ncbi:IgaA/UmoB family intracellular growth attenuator, partial [Escherichia sp. TWPC-MK]